MLGKKLVWILARTMLLAGVFYVYGQSTATADALCYVGCATETNTNGSCVSIDCQEGNDPSGYQACSVNATCGCTYSGNRCPPALE